MIAVDAARCVRRVSICALLGSSIGSLQSYATGMGAFPAARAVLERVDDLDVVFAVPRSVELAEVDALPDA